MNKHVNRRNFLKLSATAGAALALTPAGVANFTSIGFMQQKKDPEITEKGFFYESNNVLLPRLADKGLRGEDIRNRLPNHQFPRPRPVAEFIASGTVGKPSQFFKPIAVELLEEAGVARDAAVRFGLPFPDKSLYSTETLEVRNSSGEKIPAQFSVTEFWPDRSVRWCLIQFVAPLKPKEKAVYTVQYFQENGKPESSVTVKEDAEKIIVDTGKINVEIDKIRFNIFRRVSCNNRSVGSFATGGVVGYAEDGREFSLTAIKPRRIAFEERGSETVVVRIDGSYGYSDGSPSFLDYTVRLRFIRNSASVQIDITTIKAGLEYEFSDFKELRLTFLPNGNISGVSGNVYAATLAPYENRAGVEQKSVKPAIPAVLTQWTDKEYSSTNATIRPGRLASGLFLKTDAGNLAIAVRNLWKRWPKGFAVDRDRVSMEILPRLPSADFGLDLPHYLAYPFREGYYRLKWGMSFTESLFFDFSPDNNEATVQAEADFPIVAVVDRDWYAKSATVPGVTPKADKAFDGWDDKRISAFQFHMQLKEKQREYGFLNYGDWYGERGCNWGNNEYDTAKTLFATFARTGSRDMQRFAVATAMHQADVDMLHAYPDPYYIGGQYNHAIAHTGYYGESQTLSNPNGRRGTWSMPAGSTVAAANGHTWTGGLLDAWRYTGAARTRDAALGLGEHITWSMVKDFIVLGNHERTAGWSLTAICQLVESTNDTEYLNAARQIVAIPLKEQNFDKGGAWPHVLPAGHAGGHENTFGNAVFLIGTVVEGLRQYHRLTGDPAAKKSLEAACEWLKITRNTKTGQWPYTASWDGKPYMDANDWAIDLAPAMLYAARICNRDDLAEAAISGLKSAYERDRDADLGKALSQTGLFVGDMIEELKQWDRKKGLIIEFI